jgi:hypothetical protein
MDRIAKNISGAEELPDAAAHAHRSAEQQNGKQDHLTGHEHSRLALEHSREAVNRVTPPPKDVEWLHSATTRSQR